MENLLGDSHFITILFRHSSLAAMSQEKYSLRWHNYSDHLKSMMKELMMNEDFSDVTFVTDDKKLIKANVHILSACSPVFKEIFKKEKSSSTIMYLRGIQFSEMESIMQFIYLGETTFDEERIDEFLDVARSLEIEELCRSITETNCEPEEEPQKSGPDRQTDSFGQLDIEAQNERKEEVVSMIGKIECEPWWKKFSRSHIQSKHEGIMYGCNQCDYQASYKSDLAKHIKSIHGGIQYNCGQCPYQATRKVSLKLHIKSKHEGVKYPCNYCDYQATQQSNLTLHIQSKHEGIRYSCPHCNFQARRQRVLRTHIRKRHNLNEQAVSNYRVKLE